MKKILLGLACVAILASCESGKKPNAQAFLESLDSLKVSEPTISQEVISDIIQQIPSPLEISVLLKDAGKKYDKKLLNSTDNISKYNSNYKKAVNLGIFGTDLGYCNIYEQNQDAIFYLNAIKELADGLSIGQFFDIGTIKRLATNSRNLDSLLLITTKNFNNINSYLQEQRRSNLSILLLAGGWLEALHITCQIVEKNPSSVQLQEKIGEQKIIMENIMLLLSFYADSDPNITDLIEKLGKLQAEFQKVEIVYTYGEPTFVEEDGVLVIKQNSSSKVNITPENIKAITEITKEVREQLIS